MRKERKDKGRGPHRKRLKITKGGIRRAGGRSWRCRLRREAGRRGRFEREVSEAWLLL